MPTSTLEKSQLLLATAIKIEDLLSGSNAKVLRGALTQAAVYLDHNTDEMASRRYGKEMSLRPLVHNAVAAQRTCEELGIPVQEGHTAQDVVATAGRRLGLTPEATAEIIAGMDLSKSELPAPEVVSRSMKQDTAMTAFLCNVKAVAPELYAEKVPEPLQHAVDVQLATLTEDREQRGRAQYRTPVEREAQSIRVGLDVDMIQDWKTTVQALQQAKPDMNLGRMMKELDNLETSFHTSYATRLPKLNVEGEKTGVVLTGKGCAEKMVEVVKAARATYQQLAALEVEVKAPEAQAEASAPGIVVPEVLETAPDPVMEDIAPMTPDPKTVTTPEAKTTEAEAAKPKTNTRRKTKDKDVELG